MIEYYKDPEKIIKTITTTFDDLEKQGHTSVTDYCRFLMELNPERYGDMAVEVYRGDMLCLVVRRVDEAAELMPGKNGFVKFDKTKRKKAPYSLCDAFKSSSGTNTPETI